MQYRPLGRTGIKVSPYCLGAMMFGKLANSDHQECARMVHRALDAGINFIDTADAYSKGESEEIVGKALRGRRDNVILATKAYQPMSDDPNCRGSSRRWLVRAVEDSLRRLQTDYIDLYQIHRPTPDTDYEETLSALSDLMHAGKIRAFGASTYPASDIVEAQWTAERRGLGRFRTEQPPYSILNRGIEREVLPTCQRYGMGVLTWSPLAKGMLTGKYRRGECTPDTVRAKFFPTAMSDEASIDKVEQLILLADSAGIPLMHMALAFVLTHPAVTSAIVGPRTPEHLEGYIAGANVSLDDVILDEIDKIVPPGLDIAPLEGAAYIPPAIKERSLRRRPALERSAV